MAVSKIFFQHCFETIVKQCCDTSIASFGNYLAYFQHKLEEEKNILSSLSTKHLIFIINKTSYLHYHLCQPVFARKS